MSSQKNVFLFFIKTNSMKNMKRKSCSIILVKTRTNMKSCLLGRNLREIKICYFKLNFHEWKKNVKYTPSL